ncbi:hypothetical protein [Streptomyces sp. NBRC 110465]|uniref:hypothetical protein n=1 Tax=Streptomyces sp. NBRC 110465 TaxID=1897621 RepID=UPI0009332317|nr:hypothetical protein [Streptomyces sp. NBRC 110465]
MNDTNAQRAARGAAIVAQFLEQAPAYPGIADRVMRANWYVGEVGTTSQDPWSEEAEGLRDALVDVLHHADGWHTVTAVLDAAISAVDALPAGWAEAYRAYSTMPPSPTVDVPDTTDVHDLRAIVGAATELLMAGPAQFTVTANGLADEAEMRFLDEAEAARFGAVRNAREAAASS